MSKLFVFIFYVSISISSESTKVFAEGFNCIHTSNGVFVIAAGDQGNIFRSYNSGNSWSKSTEPSVNFKSVFTRSNIIWITGDNGKVYKSTTISQYLHLIIRGRTASINSIHFTSELTGYVCGDNGALYRIC
ncbi:MAG: hypothetical protein IPL16_18825 [Ignavibacteria bacterium]|nr:hypothetical protein [Ignavibacteria bacterium]